jgi:hypothetical protein
VARATRQGYLAHLEPVSSRRTGQEARAQRAGAATRAIEAGAGSMRLRVAMQKWGMEKSRSSGDMQDDRLVQRRA